MLKIKGFKIDSVDLPSGDGLVPAPNFCLMEVVDQAENEYLVPVSFELKETIETIINLQEKER